MPDNSARAHPALSSERDDQRWRRRRGCAGLDRLEFWCRPLELDGGNQSGVVPTQRIQRLARRRREHHVEGLGKWFTESRIIRLHGEHLRHQRRQLASNDDGQLPRRSLIQRCHRATRNLRATYIRPVPSSVSDAGSGTAAMSVVRSPPRAPMLPVLSTPVGPGPIRSDAK